MADETAPNTISLAGRDWPVRRLTIRQNREAHDPLMRILRKVNASEMATGLDLTADDLADMGNVIFIVLARTHPELTRDEFEDLEITALEMVGAIGAITGLAGFTNQAAA